MKQAKENFCEQVDQFRLFNQLEDGLFVNLSKAAF